MADDAVAPPAAQRASQDSASRSGGWLRSRSAEDDRLGFLAVLGFAAVCAVGAVDLVAGAVVLALFAAAGSIRKLRKNAWVTLVVVLGTVASRFYPEAAVVLAFVTIGFLVARGWFVVRNFRVVVLGLAAYALAIASFLELVPRLRRTLAGDAIPPAFAALDPVRVGAGVGFAVGAVFMMLALLHAGRRGYPPARALEVMSILPMVLVGIVLPFATGAFATAGVVDLAAETGVDRHLGEVAARAHAALVALRAYAGR